MCRRIRQKLDFVADDLATQLQPSDEDLEAYLSEHPDDFRVDPRVSFSQVFFDPERNDDSLEVAVNDLVVRLREDPAIDAQEQGDRTLLEFRYEDVSQREVANLFGKQFAETLVKLEPGTWAGPIESSYGVHAVLVEDLSGGALPALEDVGEIVRREWEHVRRQELTEKYYEGLIDKYNVVVEWPESEAE